MYGLDQEEGLTPLDIYNADVDSVCIDLTKLHNKMQGVQSRVSSIDLSHKPQLENLKMRMRSFT